MLSPSAAIFSILLILTGFAKVLRPHDVQKALVSLGVPRLPAVGIVVGALEIVVGVSALLSPRVLVVQGSMYLIFAIWVFFALRADVPIASCGCLGRDDTPPTIAHIVLNVIGAGVSFLAAYGGGLHLVLDLASSAQLIVIAAGVFLSYALLSHGAVLVGLRNR